MGSEMTRMDCVGIFTAGRTGFFDTHRNLIESSNKFGFNSVFDGGPYWNQSLTRCIKNALNAPLICSVVDQSGREIFFSHGEGEARAFLAQPGHESCALIKRPAKYLLFFDGDSIWTHDDLARLYEIIDHSTYCGKDIDAVWPTQSDRHGNKPLCYNWAAPALSYDHSSPIMQHPHGHFGCTFIRREVFTKLPEPWLWGQPGKAGTWELSEANPGKMDDDTYFWMKFTQAGFMGCVANQTVIGHMQLGIRWQVGPKVVWQRIQDYYQHGKPYGARAPHPVEYPEKHPTSVSTYPGEFDDPTAPKPNVTNAPQSATIGTADCSNYAPPEIAT